MDCRGADERENRSVPFPVRCPKAICLFLLMEKFNRRPAECRSRATIRPNCPSIANLISWTAMVAIRFSEFSPMRFLIHWRLVQKAIIMSSLNPRRFAGSRNTKRICMARAGIGKK